MKRDADKGELLLWASARGLAADVSVTMNGSPSTSCERHYIRNSMLTTRLGRYPPTGGRNYCDGWGSVRKGQARQAGSALCSLERARGHSRIPRHQGGGHGRRRQRGPRRPALRSSRCAWKLHAAHEAPTQYHSSPLAQMLTHTLKTSSLTPIFRIPAPAARCSSDIAPSFCLRPTRTSSLVLLPNLLAPVTPAPALFANCPRRPLRGRVPAAVQGLLAGRARRCGRHAAAPGGTGRQPAGGAAAAGGGGKGGA